MRVQNRIRSFRIVLASAAMVLGLVATYAMLAQPKIEIEYESKSYNEVDKDRVLGNCADSSGSCSISLPGGTHSSFESPDGVQTEVVAELLGLVPDQGQDQDQGQGQAEFGCSHDHLASGESLVAWANGSRYTYRVKETRWSLKGASSTYLPGTFKAFIVDPSSITCDVIKTQDIPEPLAQ